MDIFLHFRNGRRTITRASHAAKGCSQYFVSFCVKGPVTVAVPALCLLILRLFSGLLTCTSKCVFASFSVLFDGHPTSACGTSPTTPSAPPVVEGQNMPSTVTAGVIGTREGVLGREKRWSATRRGRVRPQPRSAQLGRSSTAGGEKRWWLGVEHTSHEQRRGAERRCQPDCG